MKANEALKSFVDKIESKDAAKARSIVKQIKQECGISSFVYSNWRLGRTPIGKLQRHKISEIAGYDVFNNVID